MLVAGLPPAVVNSPPTYRLPADTARAKTPPLRPEPKGAQLLPFHLATLLAGLPPAELKEPLAYRSLPETAKARTLAEEAPLVIPGPSPIQLVPFHLAIQLTVLPPAVRKVPPTYRSEPDSASAETSLSTPVPNADQLLPLHLATRLAAMPPAVVKAPPAYTLEPDTASAYTG